MTDQRWTQLESFVRAETGSFSRQVITPSTSLEDDLDLTGDDADDFMAKFFAHFKIDAGDFDSGRYHLGEGSGLVLLFATLLSKKKRDRLKRIPLTMAMLQEAIRIGRWETARVEGVASTSV
jgi:hypothetical protein